MNRPALGAAVAALLAALAGCGGDSSPAPASAASSPPPAPKPSEPRRPAELYPDEWPAGREGIVFAFDVADRPATAYDANGALLAGYGLGHRGIEPVDMAIRDRRGRLVTGRGSFVATKAGAFVARAARQFRSVTLEARFIPDTLSQYGPAAIVSLGRGPDDTCIALAQSGGAVLLRLRTSDAPDPAGVRELTLFDLAEPAPVHVAVSYEPGRLLCRRDGRTVLESSDITGDLGGWDGGELTLGDVAGGGRPWSGRIEGVAFYSRTITDDEARMNAAIRRRLDAEDAAPPRLRVAARMLGQSRTPLAEQIAPHREALAVSLYEVTRAFEGEPPGRYLLVAHWTILGGRRLAFADAFPEEPVTLDLEPWDAHPYLQSVTRLFDLDERHGVDVLSLPLYYDVGQTSLGWVR